MRGDERREFGERDALDERIDAALRKYLEAPQYSDPRIALARVKALAEQERERRSRWMWVWAASLAAALMIAVGAMVWLGSGRTNATRQAHQVAKSAPQELKAHPSQGQNGAAEVVPFQNAGSGSSSLRRRQQRRSLTRDDKNLEFAAERTLPKQEVFPTPAPLSTDEQKLAAFLHQAPPALKEQVIAAQKQIDDPIEVAAIQIEPLDTSSEEPQTKGKELP